MPQPPRDLPPTERLPGGVTRVHVDAATLMVAAGALAGRTINLEGELVIGAGVDAALRLPDRGVSRRHARLWREGERYRIQDLSSTNGTHVNGRQVGEVVLEPGDTITIGACQLKFVPRSIELAIPPSERPSFGPLVGRSLAMRQLFGVLERVAATPTSLLITGESGTGKDLVARAVHAASPRRNGPLLVIDASSLSPELLASELFGHTEGAFTGAGRRRAGVFEAASGGTVFLDEIGELPLDLQASFLRVLENREVRPVGATQTIPVDVRLIAATHRDLAGMVEAGTFRKDLYYRLAVVQVELPPLRERRDDIETLVLEILKKLPGGERILSIAPEALDRLRAQAWPGNVRELRNVLERSIALFTGSSLQEQHLGSFSASRPAAPTSADPAPPEQRTFEEIERDALRSALERSGGNQSQAARLLGLQRSSFRKKLKRFGVDGDAD